MAKKQFKAESKKLLDLMINSIYTNKEIFLRELISNASDAIDKLYYRSLTDKSIKVKKDKLEIWISPDKENRTITITDNGCGMTKEQVKRVKEPFYRVDKARSREAGRTGLGLAICSQIVEYHNARMNIQSEPDKGTIITVLFPKKFTV